MSARCFLFYGTLMDPQILRAVLRRNVDSRRLRPAILPGFRRVFHHTASYPVLVADAAAEVGGVLAAGMTLRDAQLLSAYEGPDYRLAHLPVRTLPASAPVTAGVFLPLQDAAASTIGWSYAAWRRKHRDRFLRQVRRGQHAPVATRRSRPAVTAPPDDPGCSGG